MTPIEAVARAICACTTLSWNGHEAYFRGQARAAMEALAENVTEEMAALAEGVYNDQPRLIDVRVMRRAISAAIRAGVRG